LASASPGAVRVAGRSGGPERRAPSEVFRGAAPGRPHVVVVEVRPAAAVLCADDQASLVRGKPQGTTAEWRRTPKLNDPQLANECRGEILGTLTAVNVQFGSLLWVEGW